MMNALMKKRAQNLAKNKKGFTLVELIVVLVILAILAAIAIPSMMKYVNDARDKTLIAEARNAYTAAQAIASEKLGVNAGATVKKDNAANASDQILAADGTTVLVGTGDNEWGKLINQYMDGSMENGTTVQVKVQAAQDGDTPAGKVIQLVYTKGKKQVDYKPGVEPQVKDVT